MNRYRQDVAEIDGRHRLVVRAVSFSGAACLAILALWSAGLPPAQWWPAVQRLWGDRTDELWVTASTPSPMSSPETATSVVARPTVDALGGTDSSVSTTPLPLYLVATAPGRHKNEGTAQIGSNLENPQTYVAGALLANGARLSEVHQDHVVLTRGSLAATLYLYQRDPRAAKANNLNALTMVGAEPSKPLRIEKINEGLTDYLRPSPVYDGDVLRGYQVYPGPRAGVFSRLGLQAGDVLTSINDTPLSEPSAALEMLTQIMRGVAVVATIERKHTRQRITLDGAIISADQEQTKESSSAAMPLAGLPTS